jgi:hypothetical protein
MQPVIRFVAPVHRLIAGVYQIYLSALQPYSRFPYRLVVPVQVFAQPSKPFPASLKPGEYRFLAYRTNTTKL